MLIDFLVSEGCVIGYNIWYKWSYLKAINLFFFNYVIQSFKYNKYKQYTFVKESQNCDNHNSINL